MIIIDPKEMERIIKAVANYNGQEMIWNKKFLEYQDYFDMNVEQDADGNIVIHTKLKN